MPLSDDLGDEVSRSSKCDDVILWVLGTLVGLIAAGGVAMLFNFR
jgi:hypothetical protein